MAEELKVVVSADTSDLEKGMSDAEKAVKEFADEADGAKGKISSFFKDNIKDMDAFKGGIQKAGEVSTNFLKVTGGAVVGVATALTALGPATEEYRTEMAKLNTAFEASGASAELAKTTYDGLYRVLGDSGQATEAAGHLAQLTTEEKALSEWTNICQGVYATFGSSLPIESLTEAANETAKVGSLTGSLADALNWAGVNEEEFQAKLDACNTEAEREALIRETLTGLYNEAAAGYEKNAAGMLAQNEANAKMTEAMAQLGEAVAPVMTMLAELGSEILADLAPHIEEFAANHLPKIKEVLGEVGDKIGEVINWIADHWELVSTIAAVVIGIATAISLVSAGLTVYNTVMAITTAVSAPVIGIIAAIVAGIALLVAGIVVAVKHWDEITAAVKKFADKAAEIIKKVVESIKEWFANLKTAIVDKFTEIKNGITEKINAAKTAITTTFNNIKSTISNILNGIKSTVSNIFDNIKSSITNKINGAKDAIKSAIDKIKGFFNFKFEWPKIKLPKFSISPSGWKIGDLLKGSIPKLSISWYAKGGVFDNPTLFGYGNGLIGGLGENGAEAIVPLEKNTEWLDKIAARLSENTKTTPIILQVDGKTFAQTAIATINDLTRQTGTLALNLR